MFNKHTLKTMFYFIHNLVFLMCLLVQHAYGTIVIENTRLEDLVSDAELVFHGTVLAVEYRLSRGNIPHTFVTYEIQEKWAGHVEISKTQKSDVLILRFVGGPKGNGSYLTVTGVPTFKVGDEDILLVKGNGKRQCPLVRCENGRFRIFDGHVYDSQGVSILEFRNGYAISGGWPEPKLQNIVFPAPSFDEVYGRKDVQALLKKSEKPVDMDALRKEYEAKAPKEIVLRPKDKTGDGESDTRLDGDAEPLKAVTLQQIIKTIIEDEKVKGDMVESADPSVPFVFDFPKPEKPAIIPKPPEAKKLDTEEYRLLEKQDFDPVIRKQKPE